MTEMRSLSCCYCGGTGVVPEVYDDMDDYVWERCPLCKGTGIVKPTEPEPMNNGTKKKEEG